VEYEDLDTIGNTSFNTLIILQLKSAQNESALPDMETIISHIKHEFGYKIRGHEVQQIQRNMESLSLKQRAPLVSNFCSKNDIEYLTYHDPVPRNEGRACVANELNHQWTRI
jgi:hypothetical protein